MLLQSSTNSEYLQNNKQYLLEVKLSSMINSDLNLTLQCSTPESITETPAISDFKPVGIQGRSSLFYFDSVGNRTLGFNLKIAADNILTNSDPTTEPLEKLTETVNILKALGRPQYTQSGIVPNYVYCQIGEQFTIKGIYKLGALKWSGPIRYGMYSVVDTSITITEVRDENLSDDDILNNLEYEIIDI